MPRFEVTISRQAWLQRTYLVEADTAKAAEENVSDAIDANSLADGAQNRAMIDESFAEDGLDRWQVIETKPAA